MGIADHFNGPKYRRESEQQRGEIERLGAELEQLKQQYKRLQGLARKYGVMELLEVQGLIEAEKAVLEQVRADSQARAHELAGARAQLEDLRRELVVVEEDLLLERFALYRPSFALTTSGAYRERLDQIRARQKQMIEEGTATTGSTTWTLQGNAAAGRRAVNDMIKLVLRAFNNEAECCVLNVRFDNIRQAEKRIDHAFEALNRLGRIMSVRIADEYRRLKIDELQLAHEFQLKLQQERNRAEPPPGDGAHATRAGYVFVASNIGAFGEDVFKIGLTREPDPMQCVDRLGNDAVPFAFDLHAYVYSDDAPALQARLHERFEPMRLNRADARKDFFRTSIDEIEQALRSHADPAVAVVRKAPAREYREGLRRD
jgi:hypothetical protein